MYAHEVRADARGDRIHLPQILGEAITADHRGPNEESESRLQHRYAVVVQDFHSYRIQSYPKKNEIAQGTMNSLHKFVPPDQRPGIVHTDNFLDFSVLVKPCVGITTSQPHTDHKTHRTFSDHGVRREKRRYLCSSGSVGSFRQIVERSHGMLLLFAEHAWQTGRQKVTV